MLIKVTYKVFQDSLAHTNQETRTGQNERNTELAPRRFYWLLSGRRVGS